MTLLYTSSTKLFSLLYSNKAARNCQQVAVAPSDTTHVAIITQKDGTTVTRCLNRHPPSPDPPLRKSRRFGLLKFSGIKARSSGIVASTTSIHYIQQLPPEITQLLLLYLDCTSIARLSQASRGLYTLCRDNNVWRQLLASHFGLKMPKAVYGADDDNPKDDGCGYRYYRDNSILERRWARGQAQARYMTGHTDSVYCIVRYNTHYLVSGSRDHSVRVWDLKTYACIANKTHHEGSVLCLKIAGDWMVSGSSDGTCVIWRSLPCPIPVSRLRGHTSGVLDVCIVKDRWIVSASRDGTVRVWDKGSSKEIRRLEGHTGPVNALQVHNDHVLSASGDGKLKLWHVETGECLRTFVGHVRGLACARFYGNRIYSGGQDALLKIWDPISGQCLDTLAGHEQLIRTVDCCEGRVITGSYDRTLRVWDSATGRCLLSFQNGHESWIFNALISPTQIISAGQDKRILVLDFGYALQLIERSC